ncbi:hypothetical protein ACO0M4_38175 [Streptomyces sp. RGM 3693]|uniref:hypothetical protein n=1 Tax=Streptomyces sp. RGM 3693 TaxID=3413284 RepID=UPI003D28D8DD
MGWTILYIAFALVALWLLGEVLFQHKAPLRWRLLALCGFLGVVAGVLIPSVIVIALGAIAFAAGQTFVTLSVRRGFAEGWTIGGRPKPNRRRRARSSRAPAAGPNLQVSGLAEETAPATADAVSETAPGGHGGDGAGSPDPYQVLPDAAGPGEPPAAPEFFGYAHPDAPTVYAPQPLPDETGAYGVYSPDARPDPLTAPGAYDLFGNAAAEGDGNGHGYGGGYAPTAGQDGYAPTAGQDGYAPTTGQDGYADPYPAYADGAYHGEQVPYSDPYIGTQQYAAHYEPYEEPDPFGRAPYQAEQYYDGLGGQPAQHYGQEYYPETPPDGVWVPQQRETGHPAEQPTYPPQQQPTYPPPQQSGYDEQRYHY